MRTLLIALILASPLAAPAAGPAPGTWRAVLESPGGDLPFGLRLEQDAAGWRGFVTNGAEEIPIPEVRVEKERIILDWAHYDAQIRAVLEPDGTLSGRYWRQRSLGRSAEMPFRATPATSWRFAPDEAEAGAGDFAGRWSVDFESEEDPAIAEFGPAEDGVRGTFLTVTGDYRYLAGAVVDGELRLSVFDGAHAFLFHARRQADGSLRGDFWSANYWHDPWTATRDEQAVLADAFAQTKWTEGADLASLQFPDLEGKPRRLDDPEFAGKARILYVFGSWCPNCADATDLLVELHDRYADRGLAILGLAFEHTGEFRRDARQVRRYAQHHGVPYPLLVSGLSEKSDASKALPILDKVRSYPTTIFLDGAGVVRAIHTGFSGPATGEAYTNLRARFTALIEQMLAEADTGR